ncbi:MAG: hypothetical protein RLZZ231_599 [Bacteroidota bacterium]|jgi:hypothetical protein
MMNELDLLKKDWHKNKTNFQQVTEHDIYKMIHKKSSSIVKWILIISIVEFIILNGLSFLINVDEYEVFLKIHPYLNVLEKLNYFIIIGFIYLFYKNYQTISTLDSSKKLINDILKTKRIVNYYIYWNVIISTIFGGYGVIDGFTSTFEHVNSKIIISSTKFYIIFGISMVILISFILVFYHLLYGLLLRKLKTNYSELKQIEELEH